MTAPLECRTYTHARRHPLVIGRIGGFTLPTPLTPVQAAVLLGSAGLLIGTRHIWARLPGATDLAVAVTIPIMLAWAVRHARVEGRAPARFARGVLTYLLRPRAGLPTGPAAATPFARPSWLATRRRSTGR